jgi:hypothetical protein
VAEDEDRLEPAGGEAVESHGYIPYGFTLDYVRKARSDMGQEAARDLLLKWWRAKQARVVSAESQTHQKNARQARWLDTDDDLLRRSWWLKADLGRLLGQRPAEKAKEQEWPDNPGLALLPTLDRSKTKLPLPVNKLCTEMKRRAREGELKPRWQPEAEALSMWGDVNCPDEPHSKHTIRKNPKLKAEYERLRQGIF